jgi:hypothetical protein
MSQDLTIDHKGLPEHEYMRRTIKTVVQNNYHFLNNITFYYSVTDGGYAIWEGSTVAIFKIKYK